MIKPGLVSVTFRKRSVEEIVALAKEAGLEAIEWGGDIHVPPGDLARAGDVRRLTEEAGLAVCSYGSYYRAGIRNETDFGEWLAAAKALNAPNIRVWAGNTGSVAADSHVWNEVALDTRRICGMAAAEGIAVSYELHDGTLTDTAGSALEILDIVGHENLRTYWQPPHDLTPAERLGSLNDLMPRVTNAHVFYWENRERLPLEAGREQWRMYLDALKNDAGLHFALLEFVKDDSAEQFAEDAGVLLDMLK